MLKWKAFPVFLAIILLVVTGVACDSFNLKLQNSQKLAQTTVTHEPTYAFDGQEATLKLTKTETLTSPESWKFTFTYDSKQAGFGDRVGQSLAQAVTPHTAVVTVEQGKVTAAVLDGKWDMVQQKLIN